MKINIYEHASSKAEHHFDDQVGSRRLWTAVLLQALEDWQSSSLGKKMEAERFLFQSEKEFATLCRSAGLDPSSVTSKLTRLKKSADLQPKMPFWQAA